MKKNQIKVGVFGGTFDPLHFGHLGIAEAARDELGLGRVLFVVAGNPYHRPDGGFSKAADRLAMVEAGVAGIEGFETSDLEIKREGPSYTVDTLKELKAKLQEEPELFLILGADAAAELDTWKSMEQVMQLAELVVVMRPGLEGGLEKSFEKGNEKELAKNLKKKGWKVRILEGPNLDISGTEIRRQLNLETENSADPAGKPQARLEDLLPASVIKVAREKKLYTESPPHKKASRQLAVLAGIAASDKKAGNTKILDVAELIGICDFFVITSGDNPRQVKAISEAVEENLKMKAGVSPAFIEGLPNDWLLMDYGDIVVHVFSAAARQYYNLERLWSDCAEIPLDA